MTMKRRALSRILALLLTLTTGLSLPGPVFALRQTGLEESDPAKQELLAALGAPAGGPRSPFSGGQSGAGLEAALAGAIADEFWNRMPQYAMWLYPDDYRQLAENSDKDAWLPRDILKNRVPGLKKKQKTLNAAAAELTSVVETGTTPSAMESKERKGRPDLPLKTIVGGLDGPIDRWVLDSLTPALVSCVRAGLTADGLSALAEAGPDLPEGAARQRWPDVVREVQTWRTENPSVHPMVVSSKLYDLLNDRFLTSDFQRVIFPTEQAPRDAEEYLGSMGLGRVEEMVEVALAGRSIRVVFAETLVTSGPKAPGVMFPSGWVLIRLDAARQFLLGRIGMSRAIERMADDRIRDRFRRDPAPARTSAHLTLELLGKDAQAAVPLRILLEDILWEELLHVLVHGVAEEAAGTRFPILLDDFTGTLSRHLLSEGGIFRQILDQPMPALPPSDERVQEARERLRNAVTESLGQLALTWISPDCRFQIANWLMVSSRWGERGGDHGLAAQWAFRLLAKEMGIPGPQPLSAADWVLYEEMPLTSAGEKISQRPAGEAQQALRTILQRELSPTLFQQLAQIADTAQLPAREMIQQLAGRYAASHSAGLEAGERKPIQQSTRLVAGETHLFNERHGTGVYLIGSVRVKDPSIVVEFYDARGRPYTQKFGKASIFQGLNSVVLASAEDVKALRGRLSEAAQREAEKGPERSAQVRDAKRKAAFVLKSTRPNVDFLVGEDKNSILGEYGVDSQLSQIARVLATRRHRKQGEYTWFRLSHTERLVVRRLLPILGRLSIDTGERAVRKEIFEGRRAEATAMIAQRLDAEGRISREAEEAVVQDLLQGNPPESVKRWMKQYGREQVERWLRDAVPVVELVLSQELPDAGIHPRLAAGLKEGYRRLIEYLLGDKVRAAVLPYLTDPDQPIADLAEYFPGIAERVRAAGFERGEAHLVRTDGQSERPERKFRVHVDPGHAQAETLKGDLRDMPQFFEVVEGWDPTVDLVIAGSDFGEERRREFLAQRKGMLLVVDDARVAEKLTGFLMNLLSEPRRFQLGTVLVLNALVTGKFGEAILTFA